MICRRGRPAAARQRAVVLVDPVRRQHQVGRRAQHGRRGGGDPGLGSTTAASSPPTAQRPDRRRGQLQRRPLARVLRAPDRAGGGVPARLQHTSTRPPATTPVPAAFPPQSDRPTAPTVVLTGHSPTEMPRRAQVRGGVDRMTEHPAPTLMRRRSPTTPTAPTRSRCTTSCAKTPVARQPDGSYVVSRYREIVALLHDPRISSDRATATGRPPSAAAGLPPAFIGTDPPEHDRLRRMAMRHFGPPHRPDMVADAASRELHEIVDRLIDDFADRRRRSTSSTTSPIRSRSRSSARSSACRREDEPRFHGWVERASSRSGSLPPAEGQRRPARRRQASQELADYLGDLAEAHREGPRRRHALRAGHRRGPRRADDRQHQVDRTATCC